MMDEPFGALDEITRDRLNEQLQQLWQKERRTVVFVTRRFLPQPENFARLATVTIVAGDRLDNLAARHLGAAEQNWRLSDANGAMLPEALVAEVGKTLAITLPEGVPAPGGAGDVR